MRELSLRQSKILIIDDEPDVVAILRHVLEEDGYREIETTTNPAAAARLFEEFQPDLVILDLVMPELSGMEVLSQLRSMINRETYLPILVVTGNTARSARLEALACGASDFVAKPYEITEILARVGHMLETRFLHLQPLLESKRFLQSTLDALSSHIAILDERGTIIAVNAAWSRFARENGGGGSNGGTGDNFLNFCEATGNFSADSSAVASGIRAVMAGSVDEFLLEYPHHTRQEERWFLVRVTRFGGDGALRLVVARENVTERKLAEEAMRKSETRLRTVFESEPQCVKIVSCSGRLLHMNPAGLRLIEVDDLDAASGLAICDLVDPGDRAAFNDLHERAARGKTGQLQYRFHGVKGTERWLETHSVPLREHDGAITSVLSVTRDITQHRRAEESIRVQARMLDSVGQSVIAVDLAGRITYANRFAGELYGWVPAEMLGREILEVIAPDTPPELRVHILAHFQKGNGYSGEFMAQSRVGRKFPTDVTDSPLFGRDGQLLGTIGISTDISERKQAEAALREAEEKYRSIFDNALEGIFQNTPDGTLISANPALARMLGFDSPEELILARTDITRQGYADPAQRQEFQRVLEEKGIVTDFEYEVKRKDGSLICVSENVRVVRDEAGKPLYYEGSVQDITARKQTEEELFRSRETIRGILDNIPQRVFWKDRQSVYLGCNRAFASDVNCSDPGEVIGKSTFELSSKATAERYCADDRSVMDLDQAKSSFEEPAVTSDGSPGWLRTSKIPLHDPQGRVIGLLGTSEDVTEQKLAELEIERLNADLEERVMQRTRELFASTREAERANRAKSEFLSRTSHELRTPLNAILGFAQILETDANLGPESRENTEEILAAGRHLLTLINAVLDISNTNDSDTTLSLEPVAVDHLINEALYLVRPLAAKFEVELLQTVPPEGNPYALVDRQRLKDALLNLLSNAIKYNRPGGKVSVQYASVESGYAPALRLLVRDTGPGISVDKLPRLFAPFDRLDVERTRADIPGVGLGLALSKRMVELMGGRIGVESAPGEGSVFWIEVPLAEEFILPSHQHAPPPVNRHFKSRNPGTFLYVDGNASNVRLVARILARRPAIRLLTAATEPIGLEIAREHRPDFILLDLETVAGDGADMLERLRVDARTSTIPVATIGGEIPPEKHEQLVAAGARAILRKPLEMRALLRLLDEYVGFRSAQEG